MMKNIFTTVLAIASVSLSAQLRNNLTPANGAVTSTTAFLDASSSSTWNSSTNNGKGLVFPRTNLVSMTTLAAPVNGLPTAFPTLLDGMIVYNTATGTAATGTAGVSVVPGFYYYDNKTSNLNGGTWKPFNAAIDPKFNVTNAAAGTATNTLVDGTQVYAVKGQFTTTAGSTAVTITPPTGITSMYGITIYKKAGVGTGNGNKVVYARDLYSYDIATGAAVTGSQNISVVYPQDTYEYILEYLK
ncbi:hypothetical protein [Chryseobacterium arthrosphaerae]|uniref:hypothetical protein n=1 Tax=Chryseobacterium arthrosphaerae TaxID=651561 RepID=UPI001E337979|nr:hypothetical protein [Chryseobacterium arthrosphaerae]UEQ78710.1 hypothetical protein J8N07_10545 [Chryseobacterium arthrosphaerae]